MKKTAPKPSKRTPAAARPKRPAASKAVEILAPSKGAVRYPRLSASAASAEAGFSARWLSKLVEGGFVERRADGLFCMRDVFLGAIAQAKTDKATGSKARAAADTRWKEARARKVELENARFVGSLIELEDAQIVMQQMSIAIIDRFNGIAAAVTRDLKIRAQIQSKIDDALESMGAFIRSKRAALQAGSENIDDLEEPPNEA